MSLVVFRLDPYPGNQSSRVPFYLVTDPCFHPDGVQAIVGRGPPNNWTLVSLQGPVCGVRYCEYSCAVSSVWASTQLSAFQPA